MHCVLLLRVMRDTCTYSHVILGFSRCGQLLLSYRSELDVTATQSTYTLHWWRFLGNCPLQHVSIYM